MKKITFIVFMFLVSWCGYSQLDLETFENNGNALPVGWQQINVAGPSQAWTVATHSVITPAYLGAGHAAYIQKENVATGTTEDWLVTKPFVVPPSGQLHFMSRLTQLGDDGNTYRIMLHTGTTPTVTASYTQIQSWTELTLNPDPFQTDYLEKIVNMPASSIGQTVYLAFVMNGDNGDRWLVDNVVVAGQCFDPVGLPTTNIGTNTATLNWTNPSGATQWTIDIVPAAGAPTQVGIPYSGLPPYTATTDSAGNPLQPATAYKYYVRGTCTGGINSGWAGPFNFTTVIPGTNCTAPIVIPTDTYTHTSNTNLYGDDIEGTVGSTGCSTTANYLNGDEVVYAYTPTYTGTAGFSMTNNGPNSGMFIYNNCADIGVGCAAGGVGNATTPVNINLNVTAGQTYYVVISTSGTTQSTPYTLTIQRVNCAPPVGQPTTGIGSNTANLSWTNPSGATSWQVVVQPAGTGLPAGAGTTANTNVNWPATGLTESTNYEYYVRAACGDGTFSAWAGPYLFTTTQIPVTIPYIQDFEGTSGFAILNGTQTNKWFIGTAVSNSPTHSLYISDTNGTTHHYNTSTSSVVHAYRDIAIPTPVDQIQLQFDWRNQGESNFDFIRVWLVPATFTPTPGTQIAAAPGRVQLGGNFQLNNTWTTDTRIINAAAYAGTVMRLVFEWTSDTSAGTQQPGAIDNINISMVPCPSPINLVLGTPLTNNSAIVNWTGPTSVSPTFDYVFSTTNTAPVAGTVPTGNVSAPTVPFTGLTPSTTYYFWVRSNCGGGTTSAWVGPLSFTTPQIPATLNYTQDFEDPNHQWTLSNGTQTNKWFYGTAVSNSPTHSLYISDTNGTTHHYNTSTASVVHAYRDITMPTPLDQILLQYDWRNQGESNFDFIRVWVVPVTFVPTPGTQITAATDRIQLGGNHQLNNNWTTETRIINAASYAGTTVRLVFEWTSDTSAGTQQPGAIDNINISVITCPSPTNLALGPLTENSASITWTGPTSVSPTFDYYYSTSSTAPTASTVPNGNVTPAAVGLTGLTPSTQYYFWVRSNCGSTDGNSIWVGPLSFITPQIPAQLEYTQDFEDPNHQWTLSNGTQTNKWVYGTAVSNSPTHSLYISNTNGTTHNYSTSSNSVVHAYRDVIVPAEVGMINVAFDWRNQGENNFDYIRVWVVPITFVPTPGTQITAANSGGIQLGGNHQLSNTWTTSNYNLPTPGPTAIRRIIFEWRNDGSGGTQQPGAIDNVHITIITCPPPFDLNVNCVSSNGASIDWEPGSDETEWEYALLPAGSPAPTSGTTTDESSYIAEGLANNTNYTFYVRALCSDPNELSSWAQGSFTTTSVSIADAEPFCGSTSNGSIIFDNTNGQGAASGYGEVACLGSTPNPVWYYLQVDEGGQIDFQIVQNTQFSNDGTPIGTGLDVDFAAFGPFTSLTQACSQIDLIDCPTCPNNTGNPNFYPFGNIVDCSYSAAPIENFTITNAQQGEIYAVLITNFDGDPGQIQLQQLDSSVGSTDCNILYNVALGPDQILCGQPNATITATVTTPGNGQGPTYEWFMDGSTTPFTPTIVSTTALTQTIQVTTPGYHTYKVVVTVPNAANTDPITDEVIVALGPNINQPDVAITICGNGGSSSLDLTTLNDDVLGTLAPADYNVTYYLTQADATNGVSAINTAIPFVTSSTVIYARVNSIAVDTCFDVVAITITVNTTPSATISYANSPYCTNGGTATVTRTGDAGGVYTSTTGLTIDPVTGDITLGTSTAGTYTVTYTLAATALCPEFSTTTSVVIVAAPEATIAYTSSPYCTTGTVAAVTQTGAAGGTYSSTAGLTIDPVTGEVNLSSSTAGTYTVTYTVPATTACAALAVTTVITISEQASATISYGSVPYCTNGGTATVTHTGDTGGTYSSTAGLTIDPATGDITLATSTAGTYTVTYTIAATATCPEFTTTTNVVVEAAPEATIAYTDSPYCTSGTVATVTRTGAAGGTYTSTAGLTIDPVTGEIDLASSTAGTYTVTYTVPATTACASLAVTTEITINLLANATISYNTVPYCTNGGTATVTQTGDAGGTYSSTAGLTIDPVTGEITLATSSAGTYTVTYTIAATSSCPEFTTTAQVTIEAAPEATIAYANTPYCSNGGTATVTQTGSTGGVYTSTAGLVIDAATGAIDLAASTVGTYTVTYTVAATAACGPLSVTTEVVINRLPVAAIAYNASPYCSDAGTASVTFTGDMGGTYSGDAGISVNAATGDIDLAASTAGTHTVTYTIPAANGCSEVTATATVVITKLPSASFTYEVASVCQNAGGTQAPTFNTGASAGTFTTDVAGLTIDPATGVITPATSAEGTYIVTNTIAAANGCGQVASSVTIIINPAPLATFSYGAAGYCQDATNPSPILVGAAGTFSATAGLVVNSITGVIDLAASTPGTYTVTNTIPGTSECPSVSASTTVTVTSLPVVAVLQGCEGGSFMLEVSFDNDDVYTEDTVDFIWTNSAGTQISTASKVQVTEPGTYHLTVIPRNNNECSMDTDVVVNDTACDVPRGISPNHDGLNDNFDLTALDVKKLSIFNRYGQEVYSRGNGYTNQWEGQTSGGDELPTGTYFYMIERTNGESRTGWVYINRQVN
ncbi:hypothetical protein HYN59_04210 [Flavobacterium album]|uniref:Fibronectin type-III domain-containing protein n=1 Tax=Flavobacterium album TaxID=2175091 RepID=A0A2S1QVG3_9FLAO|nr:fibronectin type III domain-containing protein [Flavobacterium album]AWH84366.1 hypothetical protein HYN59_04210 [Flavobacterium album]